MKVQSNGKTVEYHLPEDDVRGAILPHATLTWNIYKFYMKKVYSLIEEKHLSLKNWISKKKLYLRLFYSNSQNNSPSKVED